TLFIELNRFVDFSMPVSVHTDLLVYLVKEQSLRRCGHRVKAAYSTLSCCGVKRYLPSFFACR
ncbi:hypothetical protein, partial [Shewanella algae]|uniref:hypothetical protein n=1 Tax=Shewanella algae TaxID=38313 RepID=UPI001C55E2E8